MNLIYTEKMCYRIHPQFTDIWVSFESIDIKSEHLELRVAIRVSSKIHFEILDNGISTIVSTMPLV